MPRTVDFEAQPAAALANQRRLSVWCLAAAALLCAAMAAPLLTGRVYVADDLGEFHLPLRAFYSQQLQAGEAFDWLPSLFSGFYLSGEGQAGTYHPLHLLLYRFLPLTVAFDVELLISYPLMFWGSYLLLARWLDRRDAALMGALAFTFSGFNLLHFIHPNAVAVVAHWPWLLWAIDLALVPLRATNRRGLSQFCEVRAAKWDCPPPAPGAVSTGQPQRAPWAFALISLLFGSELLIGYPQYVWIGLLVVVPYALARVVGSPAPRWRQLAWLSSAGVAGLLLGGIQLVPSIDVLSGSTRQSADAAFATSGSLHPLNLMQAVAPYLFATRVVGQNTHELGLYFGAVPLLLAVWLLARPRAWGNCRPLIWAALSVAAIALLLALGEHGIVGRWQQYLPLVGKFRFPCRSIVWIYAAVALLAAIAWQRLVTTPATGRPASSAALCGVSLLLALIAPSIWPDFVSSWPWIVAGPLWFGAGAVALVAAERGYRAAPAALILLTMLDLGSYGMSYAVWPHTARLADFSQPTDVPPNADRPIVAQPPQQNGNATADDPQVGDRLLLAGFRRADGYAGLVPNRRLDFTDLNALRVAGIGFRAEWSGSADSGQLRWMPVADPLPTIRLITRVIADPGGPTPFPPEAAAIDAAVVMPGPLEPWRTTDSLEPHSMAAPLDLTPGTPGMIADLDQRAGRLSLTTETPGRQVLVVATRFHSGWRAAVDGQPVPVLRVNRDFLGCLVGPGKHRVTLDFHPFSLQLGRVLSTLGLGLMCAQWVVAWWLGCRSVVRKSQQAEIVAIG